MAIAKKKAQVAASPRVVNYDSIFDNGKWNKFVVGAGLQGLRLDRYYLGKVTKNITPPDCEKLFFDLLADSISVGAVPFPNACELEGFTLKAVREKRGPYTRLDFEANFKGERPVGGYFRTTTNERFGAHSLSSGHTKHLIRLIAKGVVVALSNIAPLVLESAGGAEEWYLNGVLHRGDGPAHIMSGGGKRWYDNGRVHRVGAPALVDVDGSEAWFEDGKRHREGGPAIVRADGSQEWYRRGERHRVDGPAVVNEDGTQEWWLDDVEVYELALFSEVN